LEVETPVNKFNNNAGLIPYKYKNSGEPLFLAFIFYIHDISNNEFQH